MKGSNELINHSEYLAAIRPLLPSGSFRRNPRKLIPITLHLLILGCGYWLIRESNAAWQWALISVVIGHSIACLGLYAHDLSHKTILPGGALLRFVETLVWAVVVVPATMWRKVHNATHHHETNTIGDPDRWFLVSERSIVTTLYNKVFYPNRDGIRWNPIVWLHFPMYVVRNVIAALGTRGYKPSFVPAKPVYSTAQKFSITFEVLLIVAYQAGVFAFLEFDGAKWMWASLVAYGITTAIVMGYIITNHSLNPLCEHTDPLTGSTTVEVPGFVDMIHSHFSHHTEHHLFPGMDSSHFPEVAEAIRSTFPERYQRIPISEAWRRLWKTQGFLD